MPAASCGSPMHATTVKPPVSPPSDRTRLVIAAIAGLVGLVWVLQGLGVPIGRGSFMIGDVFWSWAGLSLIAAALTYAAWPRLRRR